MDQSNQQFQPTTQPAANGVPPQKKTNRFLLAGIVILAFSVIAASVFAVMNPRGFETDATERASTVTITQRGIAPPTITVTKGDSITWVNQDTVPHQLVLSSAGKLPLELEGFGTDEALIRGDSYSFTFDAAGTFTYNDPAHPQTVQGTIIVK